jgi:hypothetical protein
MLFVKPSAEEETIRVLNEILIELKEHCHLTQEHDRAVANIAERVRKIGINLSDLR